MYSRSEERQATGISHGPRSKHERLPSTLQLRSTPSLSFDLLELSAGQQCLMALELYIPPCINRPPHPLHPPPPNKPLRIRIQGPLETIQKLWPNVSWHPIRPFPQLGGLKLATLTHQKLYGGKGDETAPAVRDEYLAWVLEGRTPQE
jgi:hypothetical protein